MVFGGIEVVNILESNCKIVRTLAFRDVVRLSKVDLKSDGFVSISRDIIREVVE
jgi:hypothetical protein